MVDSRKRATLRIYLVAAISLISSMNLIASDDMNAVSAENEFEKLYVEMYRAMISKDITKLNQILDDSLKLIHITGMVQDKTEFLNSIANGTLNYFSCEETKIKINHSNKDVRLTGKSKVEAAVFGGSKHQWKLCLCLYIRKENNIPKVYRIEASTY